jgi:hypothetical protein
MVISMMVPLFVARVVRAAIMSAYDDGNKNINVPQAARNTGF